MNNAEKMIEFLNRCHSVFHATALMENELKEAGFTQLFENENWKLESNKNYYVKRNDTSIIGFKVPDIKNVKSLNIVASHSDSPTFKIKPMADMVDEHYNRLNVETYGGAILATWLDRPLSVAGRIIVREDGVLTSRLIDFDENMAMIPNVAIHQNRDINSGYKWNPQVDLIPMIGLEKGKDYLNRRIAEKLEVDVSDIISFDLFLYNRDKGFVWGENGEFISAQRLDDLACAYTSLQAFKKADSANALNICAVFDNEEVGSRTRQGMASTFLSDVISRVFAAFSCSDSEIKAIMANSFMVSADNAHAVHPNHPELYDRDNRCYMNKGVVIKRHAAQSYVTDSVSEAVLKEMFVRSNTPYQYFANRSDLRGGGTQASIASIHIAAMAVDIGLPQLAMHSCFETAGSKDVDYMIDMLSEFYSCAVVLDNDKIRILK
ncbi:MAG: M18 family aminopeptidase [Erysipelotrichaceae bacterium]|nr:M18 family aminopeptidase [Erysipelotrichaceae bacterium]